MSLLLSNAFQFAKISRRVLLAVILLAVVVPAWAQAPEAPKPSDVRILIDISGSMKKNDPNNLRRPALDMLVKLIPEGSQAGVWTFGQYVNMLVKHRPVDQAWRDEASQKAQTIGSIAQYTNIGGVLDKASYDKAYSTVGTNQTHFILLTDGMVDIDRNPAKNEQERLRILNEILPNYQSVDYKIHTISLSDKADKNLMDKLAVGTDGQSAVAKNADELMQVFLQVFDQAVPKEELPMEGNRFYTDSSIEEFTALIFREPNSKPTQLIAPDTARYDQNSNDPSVNWYSTREYDLITVKQPLEGEWFVDAELKPDSRITVVSDLSVVVRPMPSNILRGEAVDFSLALREEGKVITRAEFLNLLDIDVTAASEQGETYRERLSDGLVPGNGVYTTQLSGFDRLGVYSVSALVDGKSFKRKFTQRITVRKPFDVSLDGSTPNQYFITLIPNIASIDLASTNVSAMYKSPMGTSHVVSFSADAAGNWKHTFTPDADGQYDFTVRMTVNGEDYSENFSLQYPNGEAMAIFEPEPAPQPVMEKPEPEMPALDEVSAPPAKAEPKPAAPPATKPEEELDEEPVEEEESNMGQWILYGIIAVVNILIIVVVYLIYRKLFGGKKAEKESEEEAEAETPKAKKEDMAEPEMDTMMEPAMDEMNLSDLDEDDDSIDLSQTSEPSDFEQALEGADDDDEADPLADFDLDALTGDTDEDDEEPEFDLDDFAPDSLDDEEDDKK